MSEPTWPDVDDELFPACTADGSAPPTPTRTGVTYICDQVDELGYCWVQLGKTPRKEPRLE